MWELAGIVFAMPSEERSLADSKRLVPLLQQRSALFENLEDDALLGVIKEAKLIKMKKDFVIIQQGEVGHCFYIILKGSVSVYARKEDENVEGFQPHDYAVPVRGQKERTAVFGPELGSLAEGSSFGEMSLTEERKPRNATLIADEPTELISVDRELYGRFFKVYNREWNEKAAFVNTCPLFESWSATFKTFLIENLKRRTCCFGNRVVKQGSDCNKVFFIAKGWAKLVVDPRLCEEQHKALRPKRPPPIKTSDKALSCEDEAPKKDITDPIQPMNVIQRRRHRSEHGFVAMETRLRRREVHLTIIGPNDVIGDVEMVLGLKTYCASVDCVESLLVYELSRASFQQLIARRNPDTLDQLTHVATVKLRFRHARFADVPLFELLLKRVIANQDADKHAKKRRQALAGSNGVGDPLRKAAQTLKTLPATASDRKAEAEKRLTAKGSIKSKFIAMKWRTATSKASAPPGAKTGYQMPLGTRPSPGSPAVGLLKSLALARSEARSSRAGPHSAASDGKSGEKDPAKEESAKNKLAGIESRSSSKAAQGRRKRLSDLKATDKKRADKKDGEKEKFTPVELTALKKKMEAQQKIISDREAEDSRQSEKKAPPKNRFAAMELKALKKKMQAEGKIIAGNKSEEKKQANRRESLKNHLAAMELRSLKKKMKADEKNVSERKTEEKKRPDKKETTKKFQAEGRTIGDKRVKDKRIPEKKESSSKPHGTAEPSLKKQVNVNKKTNRRGS